MSPSSSFISRALRPRLLAPILAAVALGSVLTGVAQAAPLHPDLETLPPRDLRFDRTDISYDDSGDFHNVLRFTNTVWNTGAGKLETRGEIDPITDTGPAIQRVFDTDGSFAEYQVGGFYWHGQNHQHYHYDDWGRYELWDKPDYDAWIASGRTQGQADLRGTKTTSCVMDEEFIRQLPLTPFPAQYPSGGCSKNAQNLLVQGLSVGWGDTYDYYRDEQWIDLDQGNLADGQYVLRSVTDPNNKVHESPDKADPSRESHEANEGIVVFTIEDGDILDTDAPTGSVAVNNVDERTTSKDVTVKVTGRDDVTGVEQVRVSADGVNWRTHDYTSSGSTPTAIVCDLTDPMIGGDSSTGERTVFAQFRDGSGKWGPTESDSILFETGETAPSAYSEAVLADSPVGYWRLGEPGGTTANDSAGANTGTYSGAPELDMASLLPGDSANRSVFLDGDNDHVTVPHSASLSPSARVSVEAWIKPEAIPDDGEFAAIAAKRGSYALQLNGPRLELTITQGGASRRTQALAGAVVAGETYHVVGTYDGADARLYVDGIEVASTPVTGAIGPASNAFNIGSWTGSNEFLQGGVDEVAVYGSALSVERIAAHLAAGQPPDPTVAAPANLSAMAASQTQVELRWDDVATNETEHVIERDTSDTFPSPHTTVLGEGETAYSSRGLAPDTRYFYRVKARNPDSTSAWSNVATATTPPIPPPATAGYGQTVLGDGPVSYWRLGETSGTSAVDQRAINPGIYFNGPAQGSESLLAGDRANTAVRFDGTDDYVSTSSSASLALSMPITLEAWIRPAALPAAGRFASIASKANSYSLQFNGPRLELTIIQFGQRKRLLAPVGAIAAGQTYHVVGTHDGTTQRLYVNGTEVASAPLTGGATSSSAPLFIGSWDGATEFFSGTIDDVAVYGKTLTADRVAAHYSEGSTPPVAPPTSTPPSTPAPSTPPTLTPAPTGNVPSTTSDDPATDSRGEPPAFTLARAPGSVTVNARGQFTYRFRAIPNARGTLRMSTVRAVAMTANGKKRKLVVARTSFRVPASGRVTIRAKLGRQAFRVLKRARKLKLRTVVVDVGPRAATRQVTLKAPPQQQRRP